jgi:hypothetical protein
MASKFEVAGSYWRMLPYSIGSVAAFWTIERVLWFMRIVM